MSVVYKDYNELKDILAKKNFQKRIDKLAQKYNGKKIVIYGAGLLFNVISDNYDLSKLNIVVIADQKFYEEETPEFKGFKAINAYDLENFDFDVILLGTFLAFQAENTIREEIFADGKDLVIESLLEKNFFEKIEESLIKMTL